VTKKALRDVSPTESHCLVSATDYAQHWPGQTPPAPAYRPPLSARYSGPERRAATEDRRWSQYGGRRRFDRKTP